MKKYILIIFIIVFTGCSAAINDRPVCRHIAPMVCAAYSEYNPKVEVRVVTGYIHHGRIGNIKMTGHAICEALINNEWLPITVSVSSFYIEQSNNFIPFKYHTINDYRSLVDKRRQLLRLKERIMPRGRIKGQKSAGTMEKNVKQLIDDLKLTRKTHDGYEICANYVNQKLLFELFSTIFQQIKHNHILEIYHLVLGSFCAYHDEKFKKIGINLDGKFIIKWYSALGKHLKSD